MCQHPVQGRAAKGVLVQHLSDQVPCQAEGVGVQGLVGVGVLVVVVVVGVVAGSWWCW